MSKLRRHLELLREEYVKLQGRLAATEKKYQIVSAAAGHRGPKDDDNHFVAKLLQTVADLFDKSAYRYKLLLCSITTIIVLKLFQTLDSHCMLRNY